MTTERAQGATAGRKFLLVFVGLTAGIITAGTLAYRSTARNLRHAAEAQLSTIADLKVAQLVAWRRERLADGGVLFGNPSFAKSVRNFLAQPADADVRRQVTDWLDGYLEGYGYDQIGLIDAQGVSRLTVPVTKFPRSSVSLRGAAEVLRSGQVSLEDIYRNEHDQKLYLQVAIPIYDATRAHRPLGVIDLRLEPETFLYPAIQTWPVPSPSGEVLLVRRDGNEVVFLNALRFRPAAALELRYPTETRTLAAARAVLGDTGIMEATDYRGIPVLAALRKVPGSPWFLVAKVDAAELAAPLGAALWQTVFGVAILIFGAGAGVALVWRQQSAKFYGERAEAAESLRESELKFRTLFETTADAHLLFADGLWVDCNRAAATVFGCTRDQIIGAHPSQFSPPTQPDGRSSEQEAIRRITLAYAEGPQAFEWEHCRLDGTRFPADVSLNRVDLGGKPHMQAIVRDTSERKQAAAALETEKKNLDALFESSPVALLVLDATTAIVKANTAALTLTGGSALEFLTHRPGHALHCEHSAADPRGCGFSPSCPLCPLRNGVESSLANGRALHGVELPLRLMRNGAAETVHLRVGAEPVTYNGAAHLLVALDDITERKQATEELHVLNAELEQRVAARTVSLEASNKELEAFSYSVSHDLRSPLRAIDGYGQMLLEDHEVRLDAEGKRLLGVISQEAKRMSQLIDDLLAFSRLGRAAILSSPIDMTALAQAAFDALAALHPHRNFELQVQTLPPAFGDPPMVRVVLDNLLSNAIKFSAGRDPAVITIGSCQQDGRTVFYVKDNGAGFDVRYANKLFAVFQRLHAATEFAGNGVGLALVKRIVDRHGGRVWAEAQVDQGATFYFTLPNEGAQS